MRWGSCSCCCTCSPAIAFSRQPPAGDACTCQPRCRAVRGVGRCRGTRGPAGHAAVPGAQSHQRLRRILLHCGRDRRDRSCASADSERCGSRYVRRRRRPRPLCVRGSANRCLVPLSRLWRPLSTATVRSWSASSACCRTTRWSTSCHTRSFPEVPPLHREPLYSPMRMFVHSRDLRWSYGGMKGRPGDYWHQALDRLSLFQTGWQGSGRRVSPGSCSTGRRCRTPVSRTTRHSPRSGPWTGSRAATPRSPSTAFPHAVTAATVRAAALGGGSRILSGGG